MFAGQYFRLAECRIDVEYFVSRWTKERNVRLDGEAYFEVTHNEDKPFVVQTNKCNVEVLGTKI